MSTYTLSIDFIDRVRNNPSHLHNVFLKFSNPECKYKAALDKSKRLITLYSNAALRDHELSIWLDWMSRSQGNYEIINITIPANATEEDIYLEIAANTNPYKKILVGSHQAYRNFQYIDNCNKILYKQKEITVLDKDEAYEELNPRNKTTVINMPNKNNPWISGSFYLFSLSILLLILIFAAVYLPAISLPFIFIAGLLLFSALGAMQLKNDKSLSDKSFIQLMGLTFKQIPFLKKKSNSK